MSENGVCKPVDGIFTGKPDIYLSLGVITICLTLKMGTYDWWSYVPLYTVTIMCLYIYIYTHICTKYYTTITNHHIIWRMLDNCAKGCLAKHQHKMMESIALSSFETMNHLCEWFLCFIYVSIPIFFRMIWADNAVIFWFSTLDLESTSLRGPYHPSPLVITVSPINSMNTILRQLFINYYQPLLNGGIQKCGYPQSSSIFVWDVPL